VNISFVEADLNTFEPDGTFDAIIGRFVLPYVPERASMLRRLSQSLRPGGVMAMQEYDLSSFAQAPESPLFAQVKRWILDGFKSAGGEPDTGSKLYTTFLQAGRPCPQMVCNQRVHCGPEATGYEEATQGLRSLLPAVERNRVATATEIEIDTLASRLREDAVARHAVVFTARLVGAWTIQAKDAARMVVGCSSDSSNKQPLISSLESTMFSPMQRAAFAVTVALLAFVILFAV
jgi:hypothetical protein